MSDGLRAVVALVLTSSALALSGGAQGLPASDQPRSAAAPVSVEARTEAFRRLLEGQRHFRTMMRSRAQSSRAAAGANARVAFAEAVRLDPSLAEAHTALAELALSLPPGDVDEALRHADAALRADRTNFGAVRIRARLCTIKSGLNDGTRDREFEAAAIEAWRRVSEMDPRNAEAWAFLGEFHRLGNRTSERIEALRKWLSSASPVDERFYQTVMGNQGDLAPESAALPLGEALLEAGKPGEAAEVLTDAVADDPSNSEAIALFKQALDLADSKTAARAEQTVEQVVFADPDNTAAIGLLARLRSRAGRTEEAAKLISEAVARVRDAQPDAAASLRLVEGDMLVEAGRFEAALKAYESALQARGVLKDVLVSDYERDFFIEVLQRRINALKVADRFQDIDRVLVGARTYLSEGDPVLEREAVAVLRETGRRSDALQMLRVLRAKSPDDLTLGRLEATVLSEMGRTDDAVRLIRNFSAKSGVNRDQFSNLLFIVSLNASARRAQQAAAAAQEALKAAKTDEERQLVEVAEAYARQRGGDSAGAEGILRAVLERVPGNPFALNNLGYLLAERGERLDEAVALISRAVKTDPSNPSYLDSLGWAYARKGTFETARDYLLRALVLDPASPAVNAHLGDVFEKLGDLATARRHWQRAVRLSADPALVEELGAKLRRAGDK